jgi:hypothetical protein
MPSGNDTLLEYEFRAFTRRRKKQRSPVGRRFNLTAPSTVALRRQDGDRRRTCFLWRRR